MVSATVQTTLKSCSPWELHLDRDTHEQKASTSSGQLQRPYIMQPATRNPHLHSKSLVQPLHSNSMLINQRFRLSTIVTNR